MCWPLPTTSNHILPFSNSKVHSIFQQMQAAGVCICTWHLRSISATLTIHLLHSATQLFLAVCLFCCIPLILTPSHSGANHSTHHQSSPRHGIYTSNLTDSFPDCTFLSCNVRARLGIRHASRLPSAFSRFLSILKATLRPVFSSCQIS